VIETARPLAWSTHIGRRGTNEDAVVAESLAGGVELVAVADGMGGHAGGDVAAPLALAALADALREGAPLAQAAVRANDAVYSRASAEAELSGMGTTLVALLCRPDGYEIASIGDSRAYRIGAHGIEQLTLDHSFEGEALRNGMPPEEIARSPWRNALMRAVGTDARVEADLFGPFPVEAEPHAVLLCSDGLYRVLDDAAIARHFLAAADVERAVEALVREAMDAGADDNVTVAAVEFGELRGRARVVAPEPAQRPASASAQTAMPGIFPPSTVARPPRSQREVKIYHPPRGRPVRRRPLRWEPVVFALCSGGLAVWVTYMLATL
jgi:PPM family protein phosphatase